VATGVCRNVLISVAAPAFGRARQHPAAAVPAIRAGRRVRGADRHVRAGQLYAQGARRHMQLYGTTPRHFAEVAVVTRQHAILNGNVVMNKPLTVEEHHASRMIADPFRLFDCSLEATAARR